jgi:hypothetical protein
VEVGQLDLFREPLGECLEVQELARVPRVLPFLVGDHDQRVRVAAREAAVRGELVGDIARHQPVRRKIGEDLGQLEPAIGPGRGGFGGRRCHGRTGADYSRDL